MKPSFVLAAAGAVLGLLGFGGPAFFREPVPASPAAAPPAFTFTHGLEATTVVVGGAVQPGVKAKGVIDPPLPNGVVGHISSVRVTHRAGVPADRELPAGAYTGGANHGVWNVQIQDADGRGKPDDGAAIAVTFTVKGADVTVTFANPRKPGKLVLDFFGDSISRKTETVAVKALDNRNEPMGSYSGIAYVRAGSARGSPLKVNGAYGVAAIHITGGLGSFEVDASNAVAGETIYFDLEADRLDSNRRGIRID